MIENQKKNENNTPSASPEEKNGSSWMDFFRFTLIAVAIVIPFRLYVAQPFIVSGASMSPTFETGQYLIVDELTYRLGEPKRGDVVILKKPREEAEFLIKRIVGLPGETVEINGGVITIKNKENENGFVVPEPYVKNTRVENFKVIIDRNEYFVMGDNRPVSLDSRFIGTIPRDHIVGRAILRLLPISETSFLPGSYN
ncbi:MAG: signal peptidase I [Patescibacteria group bacterium]